MVSSTKLVRKMHINCKTVVHGDTVCVEENGGTNVSKWRGRERESVCERERARERERGRKIRENLERD